MNGPEGSYWYVTTAGDCANFAVDDENYEKLRAAMRANAGGDHEAFDVELIDVNGLTLIIVLAYIVRIDESTPRARDASYEWNKGVDEQAAERRKRLGEFKPLD